MKKTLNPVWTYETVRLTVPPSVIKISIKDKNLFSESKSLGEIQLDFADVFPNDDVLSYDSWVPIGLGGTGDLRIRAQYLPADMKMSRSPSQNSRLSNSSRRMF
jgi:hypothetical protein